MRNPIVRLTIGFRISWQNENFSIPHYFPETIFVYELCKKLGSYQLTRNIDTLKYIRFHRFQERRTSDDNFSDSVLEASQRPSLGIEGYYLVLTSRDRPKSAPYPRLKNSKKTSKCQVFFYSTRKSKVF